MGHQIEIDKRPFSITYLQFFLEIDIENRLILPFKKYFCQWKAKKVREY